MSADLPARLRAARRARGMAQSELARAVGCRQSAVSMMERGYSDAMSRQTLERIAGHLGVPIKVGDPDAEKDVAPTAPIANQAWGYCPNSDCPANVPVAVGETVVFWPSGLSGQGAHCVLCGEVIERVCANDDCGAIAAPGACCSRCGTTRIAAPPEALTDPEGWTARRLRRLADWRAAIAG